MNCRPKFSGKVAVVTGAGSGIGLALAEMFAREGSAVVLADIDKAKLDAAVCKLKGEGCSVIGVPTDVSNYSSVVTLGEETMSAFGKVNILCNNAGVFGSLPVKAIWEETTDDWNFVFGANVWGVIHGMRVFVPLFLAGSENGHIVNTASFMALKAGGGKYGATKHAVVSISETLSQQLNVVRPGIRVSVLCPDVVPTNIIASGRCAAPSEAAKWAAGIKACEDGVSTHRMASAEDVALAVRAALDDGTFFILPSCPLDQLRHRIDSILTQKEPCRCKCCFWWRNQGE